MEMNTKSSAAVVIPLLLLICMLGFQPTAAAEVVYTPVNVTISDSGSIKIDLNHDGIVDFVLRSHSRTTSCGVRDGLIGSTPMLPATGGGVVVSALNFAVLLGSGVPLNATKTFYNGKAIVTQFYICTIGTKDFAGYLGLEFQLNGHTHYGWAQVDISAYYTYRGHEMRTTLIDFAYETVSGRAIKTGQTTESLSQTEITPARINPVEPSISSQLITPIAAENSQRVGADRRLRYRLLDLGTLGGPSSTDVASPIMNNRGSITGGADTADSDPNAPNCYAPDCFVMHAYIARKGLLTDLGGLTGGFGSEGNWINEHDQVAGQSENGLIDPLLGTPAAAAVLWKSNGQIVDLGTFGGNEGLAAMVNNRGQVVGAAANTVPDPFPGPLGFWGTQSRAFLWEKGVMKDLGDLGGPDAFAIAVNDRGQIAGFSYTSSTPSGVANDWCQDIPPQNPFLWENGRMIDLGTLGGACGFPSFGVGLNNKGQVVGQSDLAGDFTAHPFLWDPKRHPHLRDLGTLGGTFGSATGVNDASEIIGVATTPDEAPHAFFWRNGVMQDLGTVKGDGCSVAYHINAGGQVVGTSGDGCDEVHAFVWQQGGPMMDLNDLVAPGSGLVLTAGEFINDRGEIAASGVLPNGDHHAILLIPCGDTQGETDGCGGSMQKEDGSPSTPALLAQEAPAQPAQATSEGLARIRARLYRRYHMFSTRAARNTKP